MSELRFRDVLVRDRVAQAVELPGGRLLVRHREGLSLLDGASRDRVEALLARVDGRRTAAEVARSVRSMALLRALAGEMVHVVDAVRTEPGSPPGDPPDDPSDPGAASLAKKPAKEPVAGTDAAGLRIALVGSGAVGEALAAALRGVGAEVSVRPDVPQEGSEGRGGEPCDRVVVALEATSYRRLLAIEIACRRRGRSALFVTPDPDGVRIGPTGGGACLGCSLLTALAPAGLAADEVLAAAAELATVRLEDLFARSSAGVPTAAGAAARSLHRLAVRVAEEVAAPERPAGGVVLLRPDGEETRLPVPRRGDCPVCSGSGTESPRTEPARVASREPIDVGIVGGGTAGCLAALAIRARRPESRVTLIRAPEIPVIGVGEATTPLMPQFLHADLGIGAEELFREVRPTVKLGIRFDWGSRQGPGGTGSRGFPYPFGPVRTLEAATWDGDLDACSLWAVLMAAGALPVPSAAANGGDELAVAFGTEVGYHLDNRRLAAFLERLARVRGVEIVETRIVGVERTAEGDPPEIVSLVGEGGRRFVFDLYVDCSGFRSLLIGDGSPDALGSPFVGYEESLFTDRAVVGAVPRGPEAPVPPFTRASTRAAGWSWSIPQPESDHVGSVYSSAFADAETVARELAEAAGVEIEGLRELRFRPGRRRCFVRGNVVALGNAYGFVEPLESTALHLLIRQIGLLVRNLPEGPGAHGDRNLTARADRLNREVGAFWDYVRWFLAIHFRFNRRLDTPFWRACREGADVSAHGELIERFREGGPLAYQRSGEAASFDYPDPLWGPEGVDTILLGQGVRCRMPEPPVPEAAWREERRRMERFAAVCLRQGELLARLPEHPEVLAALEAGFRERGPAF